MKNKGYTLVELLISIVILSFVALMGLLALTLSLNSASMTETQVRVQGDLRNVLSELSLEVRSAYSQRLVDENDAPEGVKSITVSEDGSSVSFQVPVLVEGEDMFGGSTLITYSYENEDLAGGGGAPNALLDEGEDTNEDGVLTRRIVRIQDGETQVVGGTNNISSARFSMEANLNANDDSLTTLHVELEGSRRYGGRTENEVIRARLESRIRIEN